MTLPYIAKSFKKTGKEICPSEKTKYILLLSFASFLFFLSFVFNSPKDILQGSLIILFSPANLVTDYFELANEGAALFNGSIMTFLSIGMIALNKAKITGLLVAAIFTVTGFSLFGKNLFNSIPIILGVMSYAKIIKAPFGAYLLPAMFGTALGPLVSEFAFNLNLPSLAGAFLGIFVGFLSGIVLPPLSNSFIDFHKGFSLYNIGFTSGIIGTFFIGVLRSFGTNVDTVYLVSSGNNEIAGIILYSFFVTMLAFGFLYNGCGLGGFKRILKTPGKLGTDFIEVGGFCSVVINMALLGIIATSYVFLVGGELCGPVIGGILTVVGFGACGKHPKNILPVLAGIYIVGLFNHDDVFSPIALMAALFGTTLAPISGHYGPLAGALAGAFHMTMTINISNLHAGMNLYNNGFSGGFVAAALVPIFETLNSMKKRAE